ncbi:MAG: Panacea domain-containing protein [Candidatus Parabeggiatoa sp.]|nr:Panacea domain-containing protein [Candidatus Parabeggiatoa sp.]
MKYPFTFDEEQAIEAIVYIAQNVKEPTFHRISKVMYFADKAHLEQYGRFISGDSYVAMKHGPVPISSYEILKSVRGDGKTSCLAQAKNAFCVQNKYLVKPLRQADCDYLSDSDLECLDKAIKEYGALSFQELTELSHDSAWHNADENDCIELEQIVFMFANAKPLLEHLKNPFPS